MKENHWLRKLLTPSKDEVYLIDAKDSCILQASPSACKNLQRDLEELRGVPFSALAAPGTETYIERRLLTLKTSKKPKIFHFSAVLVRKNGTAYSVKLSLQAYESENETLFMAIAKPQEITSQTTKKISTKTRTNKKLIGINTPWINFRILRKKDGSISFPSLSESAKQLLNINPNQLNQQPDLLFSLIVPSDRDSYIESMTNSAIDLKNWFWEGRIWVEVINNFRWFRLLAEPHLTSDDGVLWEGIMIDISQQKQKEQEIQQSQSSRTELAKHVEEVKEKERTELSREVHDNLGGNLTAIKMALALLTKRLNQSELKEKANYINGLVDKTIDIMHQIASNLRPSTLDIGIVAALESHSKDFTQQTGIPCKLKSAVSEIALQPAQSTALFRIAQEALTNVARHANATKVDLSIDVSETHVSLEISDNGKGITKDDRMKPDSFGIRGMTERAQSLGGELTVLYPESKDPLKRGRKKGTTITVSIPITDMLFESSF